MTFKHVKFEDSVVMRSLEKLAKEKGLVKEEPITKTASQKIAPTNNLTENVLTLCAGLRARGLTKAASDLESKFLALKHAQTLYETSSEKGEDLVDAAHPKGSHKLEDVDGDEAVFETIIDQHLKNMKMIEKTPTGKLASSKDVLRAVKRVFAQDAPAAAVPTQEQVMGYMRQAANIVQQINGLTQSELTFSINPYVEAFTQYAQGSKIDDIEKAQGALNRLRSRLNPSGAFHYLTLGAGGLSKDTWDRVQGLLNKAGGLLTQAMTARNQINAAANAALEKGTDPNAPAPDAGAGGAPARQGTTVIMNEEGKNFMGQVNAFLGALKSWSVTVNNDPENSDADKSEANKWITDRTNELTSLRQQFMDEKDPNEQNQKAPGFLAALTKSKFAREGGEFKRVWIG
jgi:hypothetical protein